MMEYQALVAASMKIDTLASTGSLPVFVRYFAHLKRPLPQPLAAVVLAPQTALSVNITLKLPAKKLAYSNFFERFFRSQFSHAVH